MMYMYMQVYLQIHTIHSRLKMNVVSCLQQQQQKSKHGNVDLKIPTLYAPLSFTPISAISALCALTKMDKNNGGH